MFDSLHFANKNSTENSLFGLTYIRKSDIQESRPSFHVNVYVHKYTFICVFLFKCL